MCALHRWFGYCFPVLFPVLRISPCVAAGEDLGSQIQAVPSQRRVRGSSSGDPGRQSEGKMKRETETSFLARPQCVYPQCGGNVTIGSAPAEFKKCNMARGCLCCLKYTMFLFNLIFWAPSSACERVQQFTGPEGELSHRPWWAGPRRPWIPEYQVLMGRPLALDRCVLIVFPCQESASQERVWYGRVLSPGTRAECLGWTRPSTMG
eukprot:XP_017176800.1 PREDICTED: tetraspanin-9 isoform X4 [Mus musculus]